jgi:hypothetical protein
MDYAFSLHVRLNEELSLSDNNLKHIKAYPNPTDDVLTLAFNDLIPQEIQIIDAYGRIVHHLFLDGNSINRIEIPHFKNLITGLYFVKILSNEQESFAVKIIKK